MSSDKKEFMRRAIQLAVENVKSSHGGPFGCVVVKDGRIVGEGSNSVTSGHDPTAHAEVNAIRMACQELKTFTLEGCELYASAEPCPMCLAACYWARVDRIYFAATQYQAADAGFDDEFFYKEFKKDRLERSLPSENFLSNESQKPFDEWNRSSNKIEY